MYADGKWISSYVAPKVRIRKHDKNPRLRVGTLRSGPRVVGIHYGEGTAFEGQSIEDIIRAHPLIRGPYHVESLEGKLPSDTGYLHGGELFITSKTEWIFTPHDEVPVPVACILIIERLRHRERYAAGLDGIIREGVDWVACLPESVAEEAPTDVSAPDEVQG